jgi:hypothetical protein
LRNVSSNGEAALVARLRADLYELVAVDVAAMPDATLRSELVELLAAANQLNAAIASRIASFDTRGLADDDGCQTTKVWLRCYGRSSDATAARLVHQARLLRDLPAVAEAAGRGAVTADHVGQIEKLARKIGVEQVQRGDRILADAATTVSVAELGGLCDRIRDYVDPDGPAPMELFEQRELTLSHRDGMVAIRGLLDPEGGAALLEALDAQMRPPGPDDLRTPRQRRADALVDLARRALAQGDLPTVGGMRPQVGILITPETLLYGEDGNDTEPEADEGDERSAPAPPTNARGDPLAELGIPPPVEPAWLHWYGPIAPETAKRVLCDSAVWRIVLDPNTGLPLDVGRAHRLVPHWIRRALYTRDRGCRWPGCTTPPPWTDAHHLDDWYDGGITRVEDLLLLCRYHHVHVHEGGWTIHLDPTTGHVHVTRPDGTPHDLGPSKPWTTPTTRNDDPPDVS